MVRSSLMLPVGEKPPQCGVMAESVNVELDKSEKMRCDPPSWGAGCAAMCGEGGLNDSTGE